MICSYCQYGMYPYDEPLSPNAVICPRCGNPLVPNPLPNPRKEKSHMEDDDDNEWGKNWSCIHPEHNPPMHICIPPGKKYVHICPGCGKKTIIRSQGPFL